MTAILDALGIVNVPGAGAMVEAHADIVAMLPPLPDIEGMPAAEWVTAHGLEWARDTVTREFTTSDDLADWLDANEPKMAAVHRFSTYRHGLALRAVRAAMDRLLLD